MRLGKILAVVRWIATTRSRAEGISVQSEVTLLSIGIFDHIYPTISRPLFVGCEVPTLRQLEYLVAVADTGHFGRAAERVRVSQPTLSEQLKTLEQRLGVQLVERTRGRVRLTRMGIELAEIGRGMLRDAQQIRDLAEGYRRKLDGAICVGLLQTIGPPLLSRILPALCARFPHLTLRISEDVPKALLSGLDDGIFDVVIAPLDGRAKGLGHAEVFQEPIYLCVPTGHRLTKRNRVRPADLRGVELLALSARHHLHDVVAELAAKLGAKLRLEYEINNLDTLREMIAANLGAGFLPGLYVHGLLARDRSFKIVEIEGWQLSRSIGMLWRKSSEQSSHYDQLADFVRGSIQQQFRGMSQRLRLVP